MELHFHNKTWNISCIATDEAPKASLAVLVFKTNSFAASAYTDICRHSWNAVLYRLLCMVCDREGPGVSLRFVLMSRKSRECTFKWCNNHLTIIVNKICTDSARSQSGLRRPKFHREKLSFVQSATRKTKFHWLWMNVMTRTSPESRCTNTRALSKKAEGRFTSVC